MLTEELGSIVEEIEEIVGVDLTMLGDAAVRESLLAVRREIDRLEAFAAQLAATVHRRGIAASDGAASTPAWLQWHAGQRWSDAKTSLELGLACDALPLTAKAWAQGEISTSAARTIVRGRRAGHDAVYVSVEEQLVEFAAEHDFRSVDRVIRHFHTCADAIDDREPVDRNHLHVSRRREPLGDQRRPRRDLGERPRRSDPRRERRPRPLRRPQRGTRARRRAHRASPGSSSATPSSPRRVARRRT